MSAVRKHWPACPSDAQLRQQQRSRERALLSPSPLGGASCLVWQRAGLPCTAEEQLPTPVYSLYQTEGQQKQADPSQPHYDTTTTLKPQLNFPSSTCTPRHGATGRGGAMRTVSFT